MKTLTGLIKELVKPAFYKLGIHKLDEAFDLVEESKAASELISTIGSHTIVDWQRLLMLFQLAKSSTLIDGDVAEAGVYKGGSAKLLAKVFEGTGKVVFLFDTFSGLPAPEPTKDAMVQGTFSNTSFREVQKFLADCPNVVIFQGLFSQTFANVADKNFCFVHIDCDLYQSVKECCEFLYPRMKIGAVMVFDDYGFKSCPGAKLAVDEFFDDKVEYPILLPTRQCIVLKR